jgi:hypothetical protein
MKKKQIVLPQKDPVPEHLRIHDVNLEGKYIVLEQPTCIRGKVLLATGGFGCNPSSMGSAVFVTNAHGEKFRAERSWVLRLAEQSEFEKEKADYASKSCGDSI